MKMLRITSIAIITILGFLGANALAAGSAGDCMNVDLVEKSQGEEYCHAGKCTNLDVNLVEMTDRNNVLLLDEVVLLSSADYNLDLVSGKALLLSDATALDTIGGGSGSMILEGDLLSNLAWPDGDGRLFNEGAGYGLAGDLDRYRHMSKELV